MDVFVKKPRNIIENRLNGNTEDIIQSIFNVYKNHSSDTKEFSRKIKGSTVDESCFNIWKFLRGEIDYVVDEKGKQVIKSPAKFFHDGKGDCKSYSVFTASILRNLNIPFSFRFASYGKSNVEHVYVVAHDREKEIIIDGVYHHFNQEEPYKFKKDMSTEIIEIAGIKKRIDESAIAKDLFIALDTIILDQAILIKRGFKRKAKKYNLFIDTIDFLIETYSDNNKEFFVAIEELKRETTDKYLLNILNSIGNSKISGLFRNIRNRIESVFEPAERVVTILQETAPQTQLTSTMLSPDINEASPVRHLTETFGRVARSVPRLIRPSEIIDVASGLHQTFSPALEMTGEEFVQDLISDDDDTPQSSSHLQNIIDNLPEFAPIFMYLFLDDKTASKLNDSGIAKLGYARTLMNQMAAVLNLNESQMLNTISNNIKLSQEQSPQEFAMIQIANDFQEKPAIGIAPALGAALVAAGAIVVPAVIGLIGDRLSANDAPANTQIEVPELNAMIPTPTNDFDNDPTSDMPTWVWVAIAGGGVLALGTIIILATRGHSRQPQRGRY